MDACLGGELAGIVRKSRVFVVGTGGIGCELAKNLVLTGFQDMVMIDLDTIEVSNLNRQFLFRKYHVGRPKVQVAREALLQFNPQAKITAIHDSIFNPDYNVNFFKQFSLVMNALDNKAARNHVNRLCLAAGVTLIESGSAGYLGQVSVIRKGESECYECQPKPTAKTYPACSIRNTPSEPIHCIVWAKHLFNQLFGEPDADEDVSPDTEATEEHTTGGQREGVQGVRDQGVGGHGEGGKKEGEQRKNGPGGQGKGVPMSDGLSDGVNNGPVGSKLSTRQWAENNEYNVEKLFTKLYQTDVEYLLTMKKLWEKRTPPTPLSLHHLPSSSDNGADGTVSSSSESCLPDQRVWSLHKCAEVFQLSLSELSKEYKTKGEMVWDKDDKVSMDFVAAAANLRTHVFNIQRKSRFDIKSMAGNIVPAIATTNAVIAGLIVMEALKVLAGDFNKCKQIYLPRMPNPYKKLLVTCSLAPPNPKCYVCSPKPEANVKLNTNSVTVATLQDKILKSHFGMLAPDVDIQDGKGTILISSEEGETDTNLPKCLAEFGIKDGTRLTADDFLQNYTLILNIIHSSESLADEKEFVVVTEEEEEEEEMEEERVDLSVRKRKAPSDGDELVLQNAAKRIKDDAAAVQEI